MAKTKPFFVMQHRIINMHSDQCNDLFCSATSFCAHWLYDICCEYTGLQISTFYFFLHIFRCSYCFL